MIRWHCSLKTFSSGIDVVMVKTPVKGKMLIVLRKLTSDSFGLVSMVFLIPTGFDVARGQA